MTQKTFASVRRGGSLLCFFNLRIHERENINMLILFVVGISAGGPAA